MNELAASHSPAPHVAPADTGTPESGPAGSGTPHIRDWSITVVPRRIAGSLSFAFWGMLLGFIDIRVATVDVLPDTLGALLLAFAAWRLLHEAGGPGFHALMLLTLATSCAAIPLLVVTDLAYAPATFPAVDSAAAVVSLVALVAFCVGIRRFCEYQGHVRLADKWTRVLIGLAIFVVLPVASVAIAGLANNDSTMDYQEFVASLDTAALLLTSAGLVAFAYLLSAFVSTRRALLRQRRAAR